MNFWLPYFLVLNMQDVSDVYGGHKYKIGRAGSRWARAFGRLGGPLNPNLCLYSGSTPWELF
eukprot:1160463-Pelagomonas_calceolata.AAC.8